MGREEIKLALYVVVSCCLIIYFYIGIGVEILASWHFPLNSGYGVWR